MSIIKPNNNTISAITALPAAIPTGKVLQVVLVESTTETSISSPTNNQSYYSPGLTANITPTSSSSKIVCYTDTNARLDHSASECGGAIVFKSVTGGVTTEYKDATQAYHSGFYVDFVNGSGAHRIRMVKSKTFTAGTTNQIAITVGMYFYATENAWFNDGNSNGRLFIYEVEA